MGFAQFFIAIEIASAGAFNGIGRTQVPVVTGIILNFLRIPGALILSSMILEMTGVWWSMSISAVLKQNINYQNFSIDLEPNQGNRSLRILLKAIETAMNDKRYLLFNYTDKSGDGTSRKVEPYKVVFKESRCTSHVT